MKAGRLAPVSVITNPPEWAEGMRLADFLMAVPRIGPTAANGLIRRLRTSNGKTLAGLSDRQRMELVSALGPPTGPQGWFLPKGARMRHYDGGAGDSLCEHWRRIVPFTISKMAAECVRCRRKLDVLSERSEAA